MGRIKEVVLDAKESMTVAFKKEQQMSLTSCWVKRSFDIVGSIVGFNHLVSGIYCHRSIGQTGG